MKLYKKVIRLLYVTIRWYFSYLISFLKERKEPIHILFCMVDHFEPGTDNASIEQEKERMDLLLDKYPKLADKHKDSAGNKPKRTWFFPPHYHRHGSLQRLVSLCEKGYGEVELHLHHGKQQPDTSENLEKTINQCIKEYSKLGIFGSENGKTRYGFIHGDWALDNSRNGKFCGVNNELEILKKTGCYGDFTFPSPNESNPAKINSIYYATDNTEKPKSYNSGKTVKANSPKEGDLLIVQGPIHPFFRNRSPLSLRIFGDAITGKPPVNQKRIDKWIQTGIGIKGKNEWIIIKTHTHGASEDYKAVLGDEMDSIFSYLENKYNDGEKYVLHYVTARELYNIIAAAADGNACNNPEELRDYKIKTPKYDTSVIVIEATNELKELVAKTYIG